KNTADGYQALYYNTGGFANAAQGAYALYHNTIGYYNTANGIFALYNNITGSSNIALGYGAGYYLTGNNNIAVGNQGVASENGVIRIGTTGTHNAAYLAGVSGVTVSGGTAVYINANGQLGTLPSSRRFKNDIKDMGRTSE